MNPSSSFFKQSLLASAIASISIATASAQQIALEEIVVTAQKRAENLQDVPIAITTMSGDKIINVGITSLQELTQYMPNVTVNAGSGTPNLFIRGIGSGTNQGFEQSVGMYTDGVYAGRGPLATAPTTMDLERVEVLKGPQGILFGKNTVAGAINVISAKPTDEFEGMVDALYGTEYGDQQYNVVLSGPFTEGLSGRLAVRHDTNNDGWWTNVTTGDEGPMRDSWYMRGSLRWVATDNIEINAKYENGDFDSKGTPSVVYQSDIEGVPNFAGLVPFPVVSDRELGAGDAGTNRTLDTDVFAVTLDWDMSFATLTSVSSYSAYEMMSTGDTDITATPSITRTRWEDYKQYSQEIRLVSPGNQTIDWIAGAYYQSNELDISRQLLELDFLMSGPINTTPLIAPNGGIPTVFDQEGESWALFGQATWNLSEALRVTLGLRYNEESKKLDKISDSTGLQARGPGGLNYYSSPVNYQSIADLRSHSFTGLSRDEDKLTYSTNVQYDVNDDTMVYASVSTGFKGGGYDEAYSGVGEMIRLVHPVFNTPVGAPIAGTDASVLEYEPEEVTSYEAGIKASILDGAAQLNLAVFRMEYENLQTSSLVGDVFLVGNAGEALSQGIELDGRLRLSESFSIGGAMALLDANYEQFTGATCTTPQSMDPANNPGCLLADGSNITVAGQRGGQNLNGKTLTFSPDLSANVYAQHTASLTNAIDIVSSIDVNYSDKFYSSLDLDPSTVHSATTIVNARIALNSTDEKWVLALVGKNLTDEVTYAWKNDVPVTNSNSYYGVPERPRTISLQARYRF